MKWKHCKIMFPVPVCVGFGHTVLLVKPISCVAGVQALGQARARVATTEVQAFLSISLEHGQG